MAGTSRSRFCPSEVASDRERLKRFEKEARSASALNHPNIVTIYETGSSDGVPWIAMEHVEGDTLRKLLAEGATQTKKVLNVAVQIAEGLARAHETGIVHRDLKPENVMVTKDGLVKILDFGLAKLSGPISGGSDEESQLPTVTGTSPGIVLGTVGYMSPEQASGKAVDFRSDQFALGSMLYEMATGRRAFQKKTAVDTLAAILNEEPEPIASLSPDTPAPLRWIVERCLQKEPEGRYDTTRDLARDLGGVRDHLAEATGGKQFVATDAARGRRGRLLRILVVAAALALAAVGGAWLASRGPNVRVPSLRQLTFRRGNVRSARFAPDGRTVVYCADWDGGQSEIYTVRTDSTVSRPIGLPRAELLSVSSKGELAVFLYKTATGLGTGTLARVPLGGGTPREILENAFSADWAPNGEDLAVLHRMPDGNTDLQYPIGTTLATGNTIFAPIRVSPGGDLVAFVEGGAITTVDRGGRRRVLSRGWSSVTYFAWSARGDEVFLTGFRSDEGQRALHAVSLSGRERILANLSHSLALHDVAVDGRLLLEDFKQLGGIVCRRPGEDHERECGLYDSWLVDVSEDGRWILFSDSSRPGEVLLRRAGDAAPLEVGHGVGQALSPDGRGVLTIVNGPPRELRLVPTGAGTTRRIPIDGLELQAAAPLANDKGFLILGQRIGTAKPGLFVVGPEGGSARAFDPDGISVDRSLCGSPDGDRVAYLANDLRIKIGSLSNGQTVSVPGAPLEFSDSPVQWSDDGRFIYIFTPGVGGVPAHVDRLELATGRRELWKSLMPADPSGVVEIRGFATSRNGQSYAYSYLRSLSDDLYVAEGLK